MAKGKQGLGGSNSGDAAVGEPAAGDSSAQDRRVAQRRAGEQTVQDTQLVLDIYGQCLAGERHFNDLQSVYRRIVALWLIGAFTAVGYVASKGDIWPMHQLTLAGLIFLVSSLGVWLLWCIDLLVYQRLLDSHFFEALNLEKKYRWLPRIHTKMQNLRSKRSGRALFRGWKIILEGNVRRAAIFYSIPTMLLLWLSIFCFAKVIARHIEIDWWPERAGVSFEFLSIRSSFRIYQDNVIGLLVAILSLFPLNKLHNMMCTVPRNTE